MFGAERDGQKRAGIWMSPGPEMGVRWRGRVFEGQVSGGCRGSQCKMQ